VVEIPTGFGVDCDAGAGFVEAVRTSSLLKNRTRFTIRFQFVHA
jgi:hypothetical protein